jgi:hypothetical protein
VSAPFPPHPHQDLLFLFFFFFIVTAIVALLPSPCALLVHAYTGFHNDHQTRPSLPPPHIVIVVIIAATSDAPSNDYFLHATRTLHPAPRTTHPAPPAYSRFGQ